MKNLKVSNVDCFLSVLVKSLTNYKLRDPKNEKEQGTFEKSMTDFSKTM